MALVKIQNKKALERLQAKLTLRIGRKPTQQEILDYCVILANENFEKLVKLATNIPVLNNKKIKKIIEERNKLITVPYDSSATFERRDDEDIYNS